MLRLQETLMSLDRMPQLPSVDNFICILQDCRRKKILAFGKRVHAYICKSGLEAHRSLGNYLVPMFVECGSMCDAWVVFNRLVERNVYAWNSLITGYTECGESYRALNMYQKMQEDCVHPSECTFLALLKACARLKDLERGQEIHAEIARKGLEENLFVGSTLVGVYAKSGSLANARVVFDRLPVRDVVSWNALITGYAEHGIGEEALNCYKQMQVDSVSPDAVTFVCSLRACGSIGAINNARTVHAEIARRGLERDLFVGSTLVDIYAKVGSLAAAREVFDKLPARNVVSWNGLMAGYTERGLGEEVLKCLDQMQLEGVSPDAVTFVCSLKACGTLDALDKGQEIHAQIARKGLDRDLFVGNTLVDMYSKCGLVPIAQEAFDKLPIRNVVSWNALITGYTEQKLGEEALNCFKQMQLDYISPVAVTFVCSLKACASIGAVDKGQEIHTEIARRGLERDVRVGSMLVDMYAKCSSVAKAREAFDKLSVRDVVSWTALIAGYAGHGLGEEALNCFKQMQLEGVSPDVVTLVCGLKACGSIGSIDKVHVFDKVHEIHAEIIRRGLEADLCVGSILVDVYAKCGLLAKAEEVFGRLPFQNAVSWNALITGYADQGLVGEVLNCVEQMQLQGVSPNAVTFICILKGCGSIRAIDKGQEIHAEIARRGFERNLCVGSTLVNTYANCGLLASAREVFDKLAFRNVISWNALIAGYAEHGLGGEALNCYKQMQLEGVSPDAVTFVCNLKACGGIGTVVTGQEIHAEIAKRGLESDLFLGNALIDMYAKCGWLAKAREVFDRLPVRDVVSWNALTTGYAQHGESEVIFHLLEQMQEEGIQPCRVTFLSFLTACSHSGLVEKGKECFEAMSKDCGISPTFEHHICLVDLLGRAGQLDEAIAMAENMPFHPNLVVWHTMLSACLKWGSVELGRQAFECAVRLDEKDATAYVLMSNISSYAWG